MPYCSNCGKEVSEVQDVCLNCGHSIKHGQKSADSDTGSFLWALLGFFVPIAGFILWGVWKDTCPRSAKKAGVGALVSVICCVLLYVLFLVLYAGLFAYILAY
ncbi:MAG: zinc ribbon domain-containing protein [Clostridia bacterium]|nr:zinc ribbon domain-containing protein [Clostridia bacterium]